VVVPKALREAINLRPGDEVPFSCDGDVLQIERVAAPHELMGRLPGHRLVAALEADRRVERRR
jgi:bifunctional DNA-binding transcriptional regulator/antitoxin component of YhaV-PrlF toxin-antitoxin module